MVHDIQAVRQQFPALGRGRVFLENAGGSQVPQCVIDGVADFFVDSYAQTGVAYAESEKATAAVEEAHDFLNRFFGGEALGEVAIGGSTTSLFYLLGNCFREVLKAGDEVVVSVTNHESHVGPWVRLADMGVVVKFWGVDAETGMGSLDELAGMVGERTKLVCFTQTCNLTGDRVDVKAVCEIAHGVGAKAVVDCVAAAPHELPDVAGWGVDFACVSLYKIYGPHFGALWGRFEAWAELDGPNHFFLPRTGTKPFEIGCLPYELLGGMLRLKDYFSFLGGGDGGSRVGMAAAYRVMSGFEGAFKEVLTPYLAGHPRVKLFGPVENELRHPTYGFVHESLRSEAIVEAVLNRGIAIRFGHMYAYRLCEALGLDLDQGVVRVSAVHYNTAEEAERVIRVFEEIL